MKDYYLIQEGDKEYLNVVMDYFPENLYQSIKKKSMNPSLIKIYIYQILRGLMFMSFQDIAHRDMKPHNVLVNPSSNKVVICDFGSAKQLIVGNLFYKKRWTKFSLHLFTLLQSTWTYLWSHRLHMPNRYLVNCMYFSLND